jgi:integrase
MSQVTNRAQEARRSKSSFNEFIPELVKTPVTLSSSENMINRTNTPCDLDHKQKRGLDSHVSYKREREAAFHERATVKQIYLRGGEPTQDWHTEVGDLLARRYELAGWSRSIFMQDWSTLKRVCGDRHPSEIFLQDLEDQVLRGQTQATRESYVGRMKSVFNSLRMLGVIPLTHRPDEGLPKIRVNRASPRPLSREQVLHLISNAQMPEKEWFTIAALTGLRACEISIIEGSWLENHGGEWLLRVFGKGKTELLVPAHPKVVELIQSKKTLGRLYDIQPNYLSRKACEEMRRLGIMTKHNDDKKGSRLSFHSFRHFFATEMLRKSGGNLVVASRLLRHASPIVTMRYADLISGEERKAVELLFDDVDWIELEEVKSVKSNQRYKRRPGDGASPILPIHAVVEQ